MIVNTGETKLISTAGLEVRVFILSTVPEHSLKVKGERVNYLELSV